MYVVRERHDEHALSMYIYGKGTHVTSRSFVMKLQSRDSLYRLRRLVRKVHKSISSGAYARYTCASSEYSLCNQHVYTVQTENVTNLHFIEFLLTTLRPNYRDGRVQVRFIRFARQCNTLTI